MSLSHEASTLTRYFGIAVLPPSAVMPRESGSDAFGLCIHPALPLLQQGQILPFLRSSRLLWLPLAFTCCPLHRYQHHSVTSPGEEALGWLESASPFQGEINPKKAFPPTLKFQASLSYLISFVRSCCSVAWRLLFIALYFFCFKWLKLVF